MKIVLCGGGSGGHITPLLAVAHELKALQPDVELTYIGETRGKFSYIAEKSDQFDDCRYISAGKIRRYHGESAIIRLFDVKTNVLNLRDMFRMIRGTLSAWRLLGQLKADVILLKGGYVCVPLAFAARMRGIPTVTHDSDAVPGLSNRIAARYARYHATGMPVEHYSYPQASARYTGVPVDARFVPYSTSERRFLREKFNIAPDAKVVLITGGSNGARRLNTWCVSLTSRLLRKYPDLHIIHILGATNADQKAHVDPSVAERLTYLLFTDELFHYSALADVIVTRAGATTMTEFAAQSKACVVVPHPNLSGGHQLKNAQVYTKHNAALVVQESQLRDSEKPLEAALVELLDDRTKRHDLGSQLHAMAPKGQPARTLAKLVIQAGSGH